MFPGNVIFPFVALYVHFASQAAKLFSRRSLSIVGTDSLDAAFSVPPAFPQSIIIVFTFRCREAKLKILVLLLEYPVNFHVAVSPGKFITAIYMRLQDHLPPAGAICARPSALVMQLLCSPLPQPRISIYVHIYLYSTSHACVP